MTKLAKIEKVLTRPIGKPAIVGDAYSKGFRDGIAHARREIAGILVREDSVTDFFMTRLGMTISHHSQVRYVLNDRTIKAPDYADLKKYHLEDYKQIDDVFYLFIEKRTQFEEGEK
jgi:hypothetical protein